MSNQARELKQTTIEDLQKDFQAKALVLQTEFTAKIQDAQSQGTTEKIPVLVTEMQSKLAEMTAVFQAQINSLVNSPQPETQPEAEILNFPVAASAVFEVPANMYDSPDCEINLNQTVYDGEAKVFLSLMNDGEFTELADRLLKGNNPFNSRKALIKKSLRLSEALAPKIHSIGQRCREVLGLKCDVEFYVYQDVYFNAACYPDHDGKIYILLTSSLLERFSEEELLFVIGHEIGHSLFDHHKFPISYLLEAGAGMLNPLQAMKLFAWSRNAEVSADRIGLICCQNFEAVAKTFFKLSSGITDQTLQFQLKEYIDQFSDLKNELLDGKVDPSDFYKTHPFSPIRIKALEIFSRSETYHTLIGKTGGEITEKEMEEEIKGFMSLMEPDYLFDQTEVGQEIRTFMLYGAFAVASSNGTIDANEMCAMGSILDPDTMTTGLATAVELHKGGQLMEETEKIGKKLLALLPMVTKLNILRDLTVISYADGSVEEAELNVLYALCDFLGIKRLFIDDVLQAAISGAD